ncbi:MAG: ATP-dependent RNA helicase ded1 [Amphiamblys sp. WSBS2006]|nr:MAG: ATP-dependent RNA helicase ded1 [Amphiamblys sp. WSBS2006]
MDRNTSYNTRGFPGQSTQGRPSVSRNAGAPGQLGRFSAPAAGQQGSAQGSGNYVPPSSRPMGGTGSYGGRYGAPQERHGQARRTVPDIKYSAPWEEKDWYPANRRAETKLFHREQGTGIKFEDYGSIPVEVEGQTEAVPMEGYDGSGLHPLLKNNLTLLAYKVPTPIQKYGVPISISGDDIMACAQTGSGKTAAFILPIFSQILSMHGPPVEQSRGYRRTVYPLAVIMAPTRELTLQILEECEKFGYRTWLSICIAYGGAPAIAQIQAMESNGCDILVATPGRLKDFVERGKVSLANVKYLVLDEADRMLDMGFEPQIREIVERTDITPKEGRQTMMYSATFPPEIRRLARDFLRKYVFITIGRIGSAPENIEQEILYVEENEKPVAVLDMLSREKEGQVLVFVERKVDARDLEGFLLSKGINAVSIHGDKTQDQRENAINAFKKKTCRVLAATSVAARGLDIPNVSCVINFDLPKEIDEYVHKIGRTARAGNTGKAISFFNTTRDARIARDLIGVLEESKKQVPEWLFGFGGGSSGGSQSWGRR